MFNPFKRPPTRPRRRVRPAKPKAFSSLWGVPLAPALPGARKAAKPAKAVAKPAARAAKPASKPRAGLGETVRRIKAGGTPKAGAISRVQVATPRGASFRKGVHACAFGERSFRLYIPAAARTATAPLPLLVMLHGCGQTPEDFARATRMNALAEEFGVLVLYPAQSRDAQMNRCWNWYRRADQGRNAGEPALIASLTRRILDDHSADPARVYVAGLSAGASAALIAAAAYPDLFAAVGAHSGLPVGAAHDAASGLIAMQQGAPGLRPTVPMPTIIFHGDADPVVNPRNGRYIAARALVPYPPLRQTVTTGHVPGGRRYVRTVHRLGRGRPFAEHWVVAGAGHAWSGGSRSGRFTDPGGPDASREMLRFFLRHRATKRQRTVPPARH